MDGEPGTQRRTAPPRGHESTPPQMTVALDPLFQSALDALAFPGVLIGHRLITPGDEHALLPEEAPAFAASVTKDDGPVAPLVSPSASSWRASDIPNARYRGRRRAHRSGQGAWSAPWPTMLAWRSLQSEELVTLGHSASTSSRPSACQRN